VSGCDEIDDPSGQLAVAVVGESKCKAFPHSAHGVLLRLCGLSRWNTGRSALTVVAPSDVYRVRIAFLFDRTHRSSRSARSVCCGRSGEESVQSGLAEDAEDFCASSPETIQLYCPTSLLCVPPLNAVFISTVCIGSQT